MEQQIAEIKQMLVEIKAMLESMQGANVQKKSDTEVTGLLGNT